MGTRVRTTQNAQASSMLVPLAELPADDGPSIPAHLLDDLDDEPGG